MHNHLIQTKVYLQNTNQVTYISNSGIDNR